MTREECEQMLDELAALAATLRSSNRKLVDLRVRIVDAMMGNKYDDGRCSYCGNKERGSLCRQTHGVPR